MASTTVDQLELEPRGRSLPQVKRELNGVDQRVGQRRERLEMLSNTRDEMSGAFGIRKDLIREHLLALFESHILADRFADQIKNDLGSQKSSLTREIDMVKRELRNAENDLTRLRQEVRKLEGQTNTVLTVESIKELLADNPHINKKYIKLGRVSGNPYFEFRLDNVMLTPLENNQRHIITNDNPVIRIPPAIVRIQLGSNELTIKPVSRGKDRGINMYGDRLSVHPHILSGYRPCLGDFAGPINEAINDYDIVGIVSLVQAFLEQAYPDDPAGKHWWRLAVRFMIAQDGYEQRYENTREGLRLHKSDGSSELVRLTLDESGEPVAEVIQSQEAARRAGAVTGTRRSARMDLDTVEPNWQERVETDLTDQLQRAVNDLLARRGTDQNVNAHDDIVDAVRPTDDFRLLINGDEYQVSEQPTVSIGRAER